jgi:phage FluMu gp28-like protein
LRRHWSRLLDALKHWRRRLHPYVNNAFKTLNKLETSTIFDYSQMDTREFAEKTLKIKPFPYQAKLLQDQSKRLVACMGRQSGKTMTIALKAIKFAVSNKTVTILITSPSLRQSMIMFNRIINIIASSPLKSRVTRATRTTIQFDNRSEIIALPASENMLRGFSAHMIICDEAAFMPEPLITNIIFPMISSTQGYAIFLSTPWGRNHFFYKAFMDPNYSVHRVKSSENPLITPEFLEEMRHNMTTEAFQMEYEAEFVEAVNSFFQQDLIRQCVVNDPPIELIESLEDNIPEGNYYAGVDFGKHKDYSTVAVVKRENQNIQLAYLHEFELGTAYANIINHLAKAQQKFNLQKVIVDQTGMGEPILDELKAQGFTNVQGLTFTVKTKEELLTTLKILMEQKRLKLPYHRRLCQQINEQQFEYSRTGHLLYSHPEGSHDDMLWALSMAVWAATRETPSKLVRAY